MSSFFVFVSCCFWHHCQRKSSPFGRIDVWVLARRAARNEGLTNVQTRVMDARLLTLEPESFDAAICWLALMLIPERDKALAGIQRALKPGTKFAAIVLSTAEKNAHITESLAIARRHAGLPPPASRSPTASERSNCSPAAAPKAAPRRFCWRTALRSNKWLS
jgi:SAM-dependent methyltransferase